ncbi:MAG: hypothetical protein ACREME_08310 [Gemmatimonadales bacterium]
MLLVLAACSAEPARDPIRLRATVVRPPADTMHFTSPALARRCAGGEAILLEAADPHGYGILVLLRHGDSLATGSYPLIALGDSITPRGAQVSARYVAGDAPHGFALDSGGVDVEVRAGHGIDARVMGRGLEGAARLRLEAQYTAVPFPATGDAVACGFQP